MAKFAKGIFGKFAEERNLSESVVVVERNIFFSLLMMMMGTIRPRCQMLGKGPRLTTILKNLGHFPTSDIATIIISNVKKMFCSIINNRLQQFIAGHNSLRQKKKSRIIEPPTASILSTPLLENTDIQINQNDFLLYRFETRSRFSVKMK